MNSQARDRLVHDYLKQLRRAARALPRARRGELIAEARAHLDHVIPLSATEAETLNQLERLGSPDHMVAEAFDRGCQPVRPGGTFEWIAIVLVLIGGLVIPVIGWLVGVFMLWCSRVWTWREKLAGTLLVPGGLGGVIGVGLFVVGSRGTCQSGGTSDPPIAPRCSGGASAWDAITVGAFGLLAVVAIGMCIYLARRIRPSGTTQSNSPYIRRAAQL